MYNYLSCVTILLFYVHKRATKPIKHLPVVSADELRQQLVSQSETVQGEKDALMSKNIFRWNYVVRIKLE